MTIDRILLALGACHAVVAIQAQVSAPGGGESRLPKGIRGLTDGVPGHHRPELGADRHHWTKLRDVLNVALMKRPNRTPNAEAMFLDTQNTASFPAK